jgi:signal transduction histidine kinase
MLGPIEGMLAESYTLSPEQRERTEIIHRNALRLLKLVNTLLDFSRIEQFNLEGCRGNLAPPPAAYGIIYTYNVNQTSTQPRKI